MGKIKLALLVFVLVSVLEIVGVLFKIPMLVLIFKPLILLSLIALYAVSVSKRNKIYILALIFSFFGDVFLMFDGELFFMVGLVSFLIAHLIFIKIVVNRLQKPTVSRVVFSLAPFLILLLFLIFFLKPYLKELLFPVIIYGITISIFGMVSMLDYLNTKSKKSLFMFIGAIIFICSDGLLAINKFYSANAILALLVMITYIIAQYFIYKSMILECNKS
jgi:uncharacterized membrane protein YhhN